MAEMYDTTTCSSSPSPHHNTTTRPPPPPPPVLESDEISLFLHHLLQPSSSLILSQRSKQMPFLSSSSSSSFPPLPPPPPPPPQFKPLLSSEDHHHHQQLQHRPFVHESDYRLVRDRTSTAESSAAALVDSSNLILSSSGFYFPSSEVKDSDFGAGDSDAVGGSVKRKKFPVENNDVDDYDCESEEGLEASDGPSKPVLSSRSSSKRSRAAEVHNLSEKRRRSRINEKMKALQNLIPNSNKTDKASMLDEAIEYLKQLQLQVQMLSMRNGLSLHPLYLPGAVQPLQLPQMRMGFGEGSGLPPPHINMGTATVPLNQESSTQTSFGLSNQSTTSHQPMALTHPETSFGLELPIPVNHGQFQLSSRELYRDGGLPQQQLHTSSSARNSSAMAATTLPFDTRSSVLENTEHMETCLRRNRLQDMPPKDVDNQNLIQHLQSLQTGTSVMSHSGKLKTGDF